MRTRVQVLSIRVLILTQILIATACTGQLPDSLRFKQEEELLDVNQSINTKIDLLWVVDNSASMDASQEKLRSGFTTFANTYLQPTWDIRVAAITTDTYLAHPAYSDYLNSTLSGSIGYTSPYIASRLSTWVNPSYNPSLVNPSTGTFDSGVLVKEMMPLWGADYARLLPGVHDGPMTALCFEGMPHFLNGITQCRIRDNQSANTGTEGCLNPAFGQSSLTQCVNTVQNDSVRSGKAIVSTQPPPGTAANSAWTQGLVRDFMVNLSTGSAGHGSERGLGSLLQLIEDNESSQSTSAFFRTDSLRIIVFLSDEEDQTVRIPSPAPAGLNPFDGYASSNCQSKTVGSLTYTISSCPDPLELVSVSSVKQDLDTFFRSLDGNAIDPNYVVMAIVPTTDASIEDLQGQRDRLDASLGLPRTWAVDRGDRYIELVNSVGNGSLTMDIGESDYTPILDAIGRTILEKKGRFDLGRAPGSKLDMIVRIQKAFDVEITLRQDQFEVEDRTLIITDLNLILNFKSDDKIFISYQPFGAY